MSEGRGGIPWFKIVMFAMVAVMLASVANVMLDPGLGRPDPARRMRHPDGFSIALPIGWGGTNYPERPKDDASIRLAPERVTGRQTAIRVVRHREAPERDERAVDITFQGKPAWMLAQQSKYDWSYRIGFERDGTWYSLIVVSPIPMDPARDALTPFLESFRVEPSIAPASEPSTAPVVLEP